MCNVTVLNNTVAVFYGASLWWLSRQGVSNAGIAWRKALRKIWNLSPITHSNVVAIKAEYKPLEVSLKQCFCNFSTGIDKYGSDVLKTVKCCMR